MEIVIGILILIGLFAGSVVAQNFAQGRIFLRRVPQHTGTRTLWQWAEDNDFEPAGNYTCSVMFDGFLITAWRHKTRPVFLCAYLERNQLGKSRMVDFVTFFEHYYTLTTSNTNNRAEVPMPGSYKQSFTRLTEDGLWQVHQEAEQFLRSEGLCDKFELADFQNCFETFVTTEAKTHRRNPLFPLAALFGFFVRRHFWVNLSVRRQAEKGWIVPPCHVYPELKDAFERPSVKI